MECVNMKKPYKSLNVPIPLELHGQLVEVAKREKRSLRQQILWLLQQPFSPGGMYWQAQRQAAAWQAMGHGEDGLWEGAAQRLSREG
ncbi:MAG: hypothetical protein FJ006_13185 [Chloroflexi bacterium]|nr:hypothetical protein [Chloroflexota bacterium]